MKFSAALLTTITATGANALWFVPPQYTTNQHLQTYFRAYPGCVAHCETWSKSSQGGRMTNIATIQANCQAECNTIFEIGQ
ncbi:hypothetical protein MGG_16811 [Pyricularia oryzae 70-15]|uniref:WSC domain-containing protein n=3 Tax=Pyricularia oryzae TaxID=318829 RepID=G4N284_PYRO7|nr:uncharacterized protein MGG_16811 [Pyricularia oryzae 70-15]EHA52496.1 hypothetical protein MGG_16811 [Pyricularia oryzae 70-15]KAI7908695.1 hypothetical protein M9X92_012046 [Pyricularia oryzae]KAI7914236.1 hypothetical protein M0657_009587 [Pyricularia oryzae]QBZ58305.1 hypothetical protein PoMZ_03252 [Pyricularia oryzae]